MPIRQTFEWPSDRGAALAQKPNVQPTKFGDGYEVRLPLGLNTSHEKWSVSFTMTPVKSALVLDFLRARNATESFYWVTPLGLTLIFVCREWKSVGAGGYRTIFADFEQVFEF
jgi:phage-related protein